MEWLVFEVYFVVVWFEELECGVSDCGFFVVGFVDEFDGFVGVDVEIYVVDGFDVLLFDGW